jgi:hypothetical protein
LRANPDQQSAKPFSAWLLSGERAHTPIPTTGTIVEAIADEGDVGYNKHESGALEDAATGKPANDVKLRQWFEGQVGLE